MKMKRKKFLIVSFLAMFTFMLFSIFSIKINGDTNQNIIETFFYGNNQYKIYSDGTCSISGSGDLTFLPQKLFQYEFNKIHIEDGINRIDWDSEYFSDNRLEEITLSRSVNEVNPNSFKHFRGLMRIIVDPENTVYDSRNNCNAIIKTSTNQLIYGCKETIIPEGVTSIGSGAFSGCIGLTEIIIPKEITSIDSSAFSGCTGLTYINVDSRNSVYDSRDNCNAIIKTSDNQLIYGCKGTIIPEGIENIGSGAFSGCTGLTEITIPEGVTNIGYGAFSNCTGLTKIAIPEGVTSIENWAFSKCSNLTEITIPSGVTSIGQYTFSWCTELTGITIPKGVTIIDFNAFSGCIGLKEIKIPQSVKTIRDSSFEGCSGLISIDVDPQNTVYDSRNNCNAIIKTSANQLIKGCKGTVIPEGVTSIGQNAFSGCTGLTEMSIPEGVTSIGNHAFYGCTGLTEISISEGVTSIGYDALSGCTGLKYININSQNTVYDSRDNCNAIIKTSTNQLIYGCMNTVIPEGVTSIGEKAFSGSGKLTEITIPESVTSIGENAFNGCTGLKETTILEGVTSIGNNAFYGCASLTEIFIPKSVTSIGNYAFYGCIGLTEITIQERVTSIGNYAFYGCTRLESINVDSKNTVYDSRDNCNAIIKTSTNQLVYGCKNTVIPEGVTSIGENAFAVCTGLMEITIPKSVTRVLDGAFVGCSGLKELTIVNSETTFDFNAFPFLDNHSLEKLTIPCSLKPSGLLYIQSLKEIVLKKDTGNMYSYDKVTPWYESRSEIEKITIEEGITNISNYAFRQCTNLKEINIPESVTNIGNQAFSECTNLKNIIIPNSVTSIGDRAFDGCSKITELLIPDSVNTIGESIVNNCNSLYKVAIPCSLDTTLFDANYLREIVLTKGTGQMIDYNQSNYQKTVWYKNKNTLSSIVLEEGIERIGDYSFYNCDVISEIVIPNSVSSIGCNSFDGCGGLSDIYIPDSVKNIENSAFANCGGLTQITIPETVETLASNSFTGCDNIIEITIPCQFDATCFSTSKLERVTFTKGSGVFYSYSDNYKNTPWYKNKNNQIRIVLEDGIKTIGRNAFYNQNNMKEIVIPNSVEDILAGSFAYCTLAEKITMPVSAQIEDATSFEGTDNVTKVVLTKGSGTMIDYNADTMTKTPWYINRRIMNEIEMEEGIIHIGSYSFYGCGTLKNIVIPNSVKTVGKNAFANCSSLKKLSFPCSTRIADDSSFADVNNLTSLVLTRGNGDMPNYSKEDLELLPWYKSRKKITSVTIEEGVETIGSYGLCGITGIKELMLPEGMYEIGAYALAQCTGLEKLIIPESVKVIDVDAFEDDISLILYVHEGSYAEKFAKANNMSYELIKDEPTTEPATAQTTSNQQTETAVTVSPVTTGYREPTTVPKTEIDRVEKVKVKNKKKRKIIVSWTRAKGAKKYQIKYALNKKFKKAKTKNITKTKLIIKKAKLRKTYYLKVRGINGFVLGEWSSIKKIKIKK